MKILYWNLLDLCHFFLALVCWPVRFTGFGKKRTHFEKHIDPTYFIADWAFEVSSEGEFEQVRPFIQQLIDEGKKVEIIFSSPSVEKGMTGLQGKFPSQVRLKRMSLLTYAFGEVDRFITAQRFVMCRYDFFPSLMGLASRSDIKSGLVWATFKNRRQRLKWVWWRGWYRFFYGAFDWIVPATPEDELLFKKIHGNVLPASDLRIGQILQRQQRAPQTLSAHFPEWDKFQTHLHQFPKSKRILFGSFWEVDLAILEDPKFREQVLKGEVIVLLVPHVLSADWVQSLRAKNYPVHLVQASSPLPDLTQPGLWLLNLKGVLCELYSEVGKVYVGGGFGYSVHSVMEPFAGGARVWCGPKVHRSTEVEVIQSTGFGRLKIIDRPQDVAASMLESTDDAQGPDLQVQWPENQQRQNMATLQLLKD